MTAVACRDLFKVHRTTEGDAAALQGLTLEADAGQMLAVLGPSGSGKSTLLRILAGIERPSAGQALVLGDDIGRLSAPRRARLRRTAIGVVDQHAERVLPPALSIAAAIALPLRLRGERPAQARALARELLERVQLADRADALPAELSGGERQRVAVCAAVAHRPAVVLADEPTGELDAASAREVLAMLSGLAADGAAVVVVTHDPVGAAVADRVVRIRDGRVSEEGRGEGRAVVVGRGGWLRVPEELLGAAGIAGRARVSIAPEGVLLEPVHGPVAAAVPVADGAGPPHAVATEPVGAELRAVAKAFGSRQVLDGLSADFPPGSLTAVTGRSGSGKSTLLRLLAGLERADAGDVVVGEESLTGRSREWLAGLRAMRVGVVSQEQDLAGFLSAAEQVALPLALAGVPTGDARARALEWLAAIGLGERAEQRVGRLSAGERQRVAVARALAAGRGLLLIDEPTSRLDEANATALAALLVRISAHHGATVVCATHDPLIADVATRTLPLQQDATALREV